VRYRAAGLIGVAGFASAPFGVVIAHHLSQSTLLGLFAVVFAYVGGALAGMALGRVLAPRIPGTHTQIGFAVLLGGLAIALASRSLQLGLG
jgi:uncharacterized membrane protein YfcA